MKRGAKVTRYRQRAKGVSRIVEALIRSSPKGGAPQIQGEQTAARYGSPRRRRHAPKQKAPPKRGLFGTSRLTRANLKRTRAYNNAKHPLYTPPTRVAFFPLFFLFVSFLFPQNQAVRSLKD